MSNEQTNSSNTTILIFLIILVLISAVAGTLILYWFGYKPIQENSIRLDELELRMEQNQELVWGKFDEIDSSLDEAEAGLAAIEVSLEEFETELAGLKISKEAIEAEQIQILDDVDSLQTDVDKLNELTDELQTLKDLKDSLQENVGALESEFGAVTKLLEQFNIRADSIDEEIAGFGERWQALENEIQILKVMDLVESSRELLSEGDISQAQEKILEARQLIDDLRGRVDDYQVEVLSDIANRLQEVLDAIRDAPNSALNILENAWQMLLSGLSEEENN